jgi:TP901 family phage tail tape measure protein
MSDGQVIVTLSVQDAEALRAWQRAKAGIGGMEQELKKTKGATAALSKEQADGWKQLSTIGSQSFKNQTAWTRGLQTLEKERTDKAVSAAAEVAKAQKKAAAEAQAVAKEHAAAVRELGAEMGRGLMESVLPFTTIAGAVGTTVEGLREAVRLTKELDAERDKATLTREEAEARFLNQARTSAASRKRLKEVGEEIEVQGAVYGLKGTESLDLAREAVSQGVKANEVVEFMEVANKFAAAQGAKLDVQMFKSFVAQTRVQDEKLSPKAAQETALAFYGAYLTRQIQPQQLEAFSRQNYGLKQAGLNASEQTAANVAALDLYGGNAEMAATFNRAFFQKLRAAGGKKEAWKAEQAMGLNYEDVDFVGEGLKEVMERLATAVEATPAEQRVPMLTKIFGEEYGAQALAFIQNHQKMQEILGDIETGKPHFEASARELTGTQAARQRQAEAQQEIEASKHGAPVFDTARAAMLAELEREGKNAVEQKLAATRFDANVLLLRHNPFLPQIEGPLKDAADREQAIGLARDAAEGNQAFADLMRRAVAGQEAPAEAAAARPKNVPRSAAEEERLRQIRERAGGAAEAGVSEKEAKKAEAARERLRNRQEAVAVELREAHERIEDRAARIRNLEEDQDLREAERRVPHHYRGAAQQQLDRQRDAAEDRRHRQQIERERREEKEDRDREIKLMEENNALLKKIADANGKGEAPAPSRAPGRPPVVIGGN